MLKDLLVYPQANDMVNVGQRDGGLSGIGGDDHLDDLGALGSDSEGIGMILVRHFAVDDHHLNTAEEDDFFFFKQKNKIKFKRNGIRLKNIKRKTSKKRKIVDKAKTNHPRSKDLRHFPRHLISECRVCRLQ